MAEKNHPVIDWDDMSEVDKVKASDLLKELNDLFDKYDPRKREVSNEEVPPSTQ
jgi:hypothetical protein